MTFAKAGNGSNQYQSLGASAGFAQATHPKRRGPNGPKLRINENTIGNTARADARKAQIAAARAAKAAAALNKKEMRAAAAAAKKAANHAAVLARRAVAAEKRNEKKAAAVHAAAVKEALADARAAAKQVRA